MFFYKDIIKYIKTWTSQKSLYEIYIKIYSPRIHEIWTPEYLNCYFTQFWFLPYLSRAALVSRFELMVISGDSLGLDTFPPDCGSAVRHQQVGSPQLLGWLGERAVPSRSICLIHVHCSLNTFRPDSTWDWIENQELFLSVI